jgi:hypothetical protein
MAKKLIRATICSEAGTVCVFGVFNRSLPAHKISSSWQTSSTLAVDDHDHCNRNSTVAVILSRTGVCPPGAGMPRHTPAQACRCELVSKWLWWHHGGRFGFAAANQQRAPHIAENVGYIIGDVNHRSLGPPHTACAAKPLYKSRLNMTTD